MESPEPKKLFVQAINNASPRRNSSFRRDLYYRINVIPIHIPALQERRGDVMLLIDHFQRLLGIHFTLTERAQAAIWRHPWKGNIRELRNCVEYLSYMELPVVDLENLPAQFNTIPAAGPADWGLLPGEKAVLFALGEAALRDKGLGRKGVQHICAVRGVSMTEYEIRHGLQALQNHGYTEVETGRDGTRLSPAGLRKYRKILEKANENPAGISMPAGFLMNRMQGARHWCSDPKAPLGVTSSGLRKPF